MKLQSFRHIKHNTIAFLFLLKWLATSTFRKCIYLKFLCRFQFSITSRSRWQHIATAPQVNVACKVMDKSRNCMRWLCGYELLEIFVTRRVNSICTLFIALVLKRIYSYTYVSITYRHTIFFFSRFLLITSGFFFYYFISMK